MHSLLISASFCINLEFLNRHSTIQVGEWNLVNEGGTWKLHRSWKVKTFMRGMEFFQLIAALAEAEGIPSTFSLILHQYLLLSALQEKCPLCYLSRLVEIKVVPSCFCYVPFH